MTRQRIVELFELLQVEHPLWEVSEELLEVWDEAIGSLPPETLIWAARRYLANESGRPQLAKFVKYLPAVVASRVKGEPASERVVGDRSREDTFGVILSDCRFQGIRLWNPYHTLATNRDRYMEWRKEGGSEEDVTLPAHWSHLSPQQALTFLDRFCGIGCAQETPIAPADFDFER